MRNIDLTYIIPTILAVISFIGVFLYGKSKIQSDSQIRLLRYFPILSVLALIIGVFIISDYYLNQLSVEKENFLAFKKQIHYNDSILLNEKLKRQTLDSLKTLDEELKRMLSNINRQEKLIGAHSDIKYRIKENILTTNEEIGTIESYNEIIDVPSFLTKGYLTGGNTSSFLFVCPTDKTSEYLDLKLKFQDPTLIKKIACVYIVITETKQNGDAWLVFNQAYKPKSGVNAFKIRNFLTNSKTKLDIGYVLNSETKKKYPTYEKISCYGN